MSESRESVSRSWLMLERQALGELPAHEDAALSRILAEDADSAAIAQRIRDQRRALPPLPSLPSRAPGAARPGLGWTSIAAWLGRLRDVRVAYVATVAAVGAALLLWWFARPHEERSQRPEVPGPRLALADTIGGHDIDGTKGGELIIALVRERAGVITHDPDAYQDGDRFKVLVTCPPGRALHAELAVVQPDDPSSAVSFPLARAGAPLACGNRVPLPGAFQLSGPGDAHVCLVIDERAPPERAALGSPDAVFAARAGVVCATLERAAAAD